MLLKFTESLILKNFDIDRRLPVYISFSAFLAKFLFPKIGEFSNKTKEIARELFKSYFHVLILEKVIKTINSLDIKPSIDFEILGKFIKKRKKINLEKLLIQLNQNMKRELVPRNILTSQDTRSSFNIGIKNFGTSSERTDKISIKSVDFQILESEIEIRNALESIIEAYGIKKIVLLFDEIPGLGYLQGEFFDILYIFRDQPSIIFKIGTYPYYTDMGKYFDTPDDAERVNLDRRIFQRSINEYYNYFEKLLELVLKKDIKEIFNNLIDENALKILSIAAGGNTRLFLTFIKGIGEIYDNKIRISDIEKHIEKLYNQNYRQFIRENARRNSVDEDICFNIIDKICERLGTRNKKKTGNTSFVGISKNVFKEFENEFNLLDYCRVLEFYDDKILSGELGRGKRYNLNLIIAAVNKSFKYESKGITSQFHQNLITHLEKMQSEDRKIIISNLKEEVTVKTKRKKVRKKIDPMEESITVLNFTNYITNLLRGNGYNTPNDVQQASEIDLKKIRGIGKIKTRMIKVRLEEYISDNFI